jgi:hypothetical protein
VVTIDALDVCSFGLAADFAALDDVEAQAIADGDVVDAGTLERAAVAEHILGINRLIVWRVKIQPMPVTRETVPSVNSLSY